MKTPEEIKKGLECCYSPVEPMLRCEACPYYGSIVCKMRLHTDALAYIRSLERERAAAVADLAAIHVCSTCKHVPDDSIDYIQGVCFECCTTKCNYEWRGVPEGD